MKRTSSFEKGISSGASDPNSGSKVGGKGFGFAAMEVGRGASGVAGGGSVAPPILKRALRAKAIVTFKKTPNVIEAA
jgi:hypothetical protein